MNLALEKRKTQNRRIREEAKKNSKWREDRINFNRVPKFNLEI
jgi:hypothetical protein